MEWEIYRLRTITRSVTIERGKVKLAETKEERSYAVRVIENGKVGLATSTEFGEYLFERARKVARVSEDRLDSLPIGKKVKVEGLYDPKLEKVDGEWLIESAMSMISPALDANVNPSTGYVEVTAETVRIENSFGVELEEKRSYCEAYLECVKGESSGFEFDSSRTSKVDFEFVGKRATELALDFMRSRKIEGGIYDVVLSPIAVHELLSYTLYPAFVAENVMKGRSPLTDIGRRYIGRLTLIDDGTLPYGLMSFGFDDEGIDPKETIVFEDGILKSYITDFKTAMKMNLELTGNCIRGDDLHPSTSPTNVILNFDDIGKVEGELYVHALLGSHTSNPVSGDFSVKTMNAYFKGEPAESVMISGNIYELLSKISAFGRDLRQIENTLTPSILFEDVRVI